MHAHEEEGHGVRYENAFEVWAIIGCGKTKSKRKVAMDVTKLMRYSSF